VRQRRRSSFPLLVLGMNSIAAYCLYEALEKPVAEAVLRHFNRAAFDILGPAFESTLVGASSLALIWLVLWWMQRRRIFVRL
jgi:predicted acyltransferase